MVQFVEGITEYHSGFQMDVYCCDHRDFTDAFPCICGTSGMANTWILCLFTIGIDVSMPFSPPNRFNSDVDRYRFLLVLWY